MKKNYTHIVFVMDRSGSMSSMRKEAQNSFNRFIEEQKKLEEEATFTLVQFDDKYEVVYDFVNLQDVNPFELIPRGMTALNDALGKTINSVGERLANLSESDRPEKVLFVVLTDGLENASQEFIGDAVGNMIKEQEYIYNWTFMYLGANQDAFAVGASYKFSLGNTQNFTNVRSSMSNINKATTSYRSASFDMNTKDSILVNNQAEEDEIL